MKRLEKLGSARTPNGTELVLYHHDGAYLIRADGVELMSTRRHLSEVRLAEVACAPIRDVPNARVLIGGLGLGFTLQRVLADPRVERAAVVEIEEPLIEWMRNGTVPHGPALLADARATVVNADIAMAIAEARAAYDLVLLDVDNGPGYLVHEANAALYEEPFLRLTRRVLRPGGALAIWSSAEALALEAALRAVYDEVEPLTYAVDLQGREETYWLYVARAVPSGPSSAR